MSTFPDLIKQREQQHAQKVEALMKANTDLLARLTVEAAERVTSEQRLLALEKEMGSLREAVRLSTTTQQDVILRLQSEQVESARSMDSAMETLLQEHQHAMHERLLKQQLGSWDVMNKALEQHVREIANAVQEIEQRVQGALQVVSDDQRRIDIFERCIDREIRSAEHRLQRNVISELYLTTFEDLGYRAQSEMAFQLSWHNTGESLNRTWDYNVNEALIKLERAQERVRDSYPELGDQRVNAMVEDLTRAAESLENIVAVNARRAHSTEGGAMEHQLALSRRVKELEEWVKKQTMTALDRIRHQHPPAPSAWRQEISVIEEDKHTKRETRPLAPTPPVVVPPLYVAGGFTALQRDLESKRSSPHHHPISSSRSPTTDNLRTPPSSLPHRGSGRATPKKEAPWEEDVLMVDAASSIRRLYAKAEELGQRKETAETDLDKVNALLGHIQAEFLRLSEREVELGHLPHTNEWKESLASDSSGGYAESLRANLVQIQDNITSHKQTVYARERALIEQRNEVWRALSDLNEEIEHTTKQIEYYRDVMGTEQFLLQRLASGQ